MSTLSSADIKWACLRHAEGRTITSLARELDCETNELRQAIHDPKAYAVAVRPKTALTDEDKAHIVASYKSGKSMLAINRETGCGVDAIRRVLMASNVKIRRFYKWVISAEQEQEFLKLRESGLSVEKIAKQMKLPYRAAYRLFGELKKRFPSIAEFRKPQPSRVPWTFRRMGQTWIEEMEYQLLKKGYGSWAVKTKMEKIIEANRKLPRR